MSPVETWCHNINYYIPDEEGETKNFNMEMMARIRKFFYFCIRAYQSEMDLRNGSSNVFFFSLNEMHISAWKLHLL